MTAHDVSDVNHAGLQSDNLCAVIDRAYSGIDSIQKFPIRSGKWRLLLVRVALQVTITAHNFLCALTSTWSV